MVHSMTGYGRAQKSLEGRDILVEIKSVNHRFFEFSLRAPRSMGYLEEPLKKLAAASVSRGKVELSVTVTTAEAPPTSMQANLSLARQYVEQLRSMAEELGLQDDLSASCLLKVGELFAVQKLPEDPEGITNGVLTVAQEALESFCSMRAYEGTRLALDLEEKLRLMERGVEQVEQLSPKILESYRARLTAKLQEVLSDHEVDQQRILTEAAIFADRIAVDEETVRLRSHLAQFCSLLAAAEPAGRKLDFLVQEMNREVNTIGSKAQDLAVTNLVVEMKGTLEKIREQIQNVE